MDVKRQQLEEWVANLMCQNFELLRHVLKFWDGWCPVSVLAKWQFAYGLQTCIESGWEVNSSRMVSIDWTKTPLSLVLLVDPPKEDTVSVVTTLLKHDATDIIDTPAGQISPALEQAMDKIDPHIGIIWSLIQHGSLINCSRYPGGTVLSRIIVNAGHNSGARWLSDKLLTEYGCHLDPTFTRPDGLIDSFVGEVVEHCAAFNDLEVLLEMLALGAKIGRPVRSHDTVTTLLELDEDTTPYMQSTWDHSKYFAWNTFCATYVIEPGVEIIWSKMEWTNWIQFLLAHDADINALDCVVGFGSGEDKDELQLEYCTALDLITTLGLWLAEEEANPEYDLYPGSEVLPSQYCFLASSVLMEYGARILPR